ncbi:MAG: hypothetical protein LBE85_05970 [Candidatus Accumulibacter sp.]|jgi:hypothetical protein|nr:hypothetical protein [Accumulibacter sp.]
MVNKQRILCFAPGRAAPGMVLAKPVADREGAVLLAAETVLAADVLERLVRRGVETISVRVLDQRDEEAIARELVDIRARIDTIFRGPGSDARNQLRDSVLAYRIESAR